MIDKNQVEGYEHNDTEYTVKLWDYVRRSLSFEEALELVRGNRSGISQEGMEGLESFQLHYGLAGPDERPPTGNVLGYGNVIYRRLKHMPTRLALQAWRCEFEHFQYAETEQEIFFKIELLDVAENMFGVDLNDEILTAIHDLPESESKIDMLEKHGAISGDEWARRTENIQQQNAT